MHPAKNKSIPLDKADSDYRVARLDRKITVMQHVGARLGIDLLADVVVTGTPLGQRFHLLYDGLDPMRYCATSTVSYISRELMKGPDEPLPARTLRAIDAEMDIQAPDFSRYDRARARHLAIQHAWNISPREAVLRAVISVEFIRTMQSGGAQ